MLIFMLIIYLQTSNDDDDTVEIFASITNAAEAILQSSKDS